LIRKADLKVGLYDLDIPTPKVFRTEHPGSLAFQASGVIVCG